MNLTCMQCPKDHVLLLSDYVHLFCKKMWLYELDLKLVSWLPELKNKQTSKQKKQKKNRSCSAFLFYLAFFSSCPLMNLFWSVFMFFCLSFSALLLSPYVSEKYLQICFFLCLFIIVSFVILYNWLRIRSPSLLLASDSHLPSSFTAISGDYLLNFSFSLCLYLDA